MSQMWPRSLAGSRKSSARARARSCVAMSQQINWVISCGVGGTHRLPSPAFFITNVEMVSPNCLKRLMER